MRLVDWRPLRRGNLRGFAGVELASGLRIAEIPVLLTHGRAWAALPSRPMVGAGGTALRDDGGKIRYAPLLSWRDRDLQHRWSDAVDPRGASQRARRRGRAMTGRPSAPTAAREPEIAIGGIVQRLADRIDTLAVELLPAGRREGREWRVGNLRGDPGNSLAVHLGGARPGIWADFATGQRGDALDLVRGALELDMGEAIRWSRRWLDIDDGTAELPKRRPATARSPPDFDPDRWRQPWQWARAIAGTLAETYLAARGLRFEDPSGRVLRFAARRPRKSPTDELEHHAALLALLRDVHSGEPRGLINIYLRPDGRDRLRDRKGKTVAGRARGAAVMLSAFDEPTTGLVVAEGAETGMALHQSELRPVWAVGGAGNLGTFPILGGIEALTIAADRDESGMRAAETLAARWRSAGREVSIMLPPRPEGT
jgi:hypothetical protein